MPPDEPKASGADPSGDRVVRDLAPHRVGQTKKQGGGPYDRWFIALALAIPFILLAIRIMGPGDLHQKDQPKTVSYTVDMVANGHWLIPYDCEGQPTQKPPLYNWLGAPFLTFLPAEEWVLKLPTILAFLATVWMLWSFTRSRLGPLAGGVAVTAFSVNMAVILLGYTARPDMLLAAFVTGALFLSMSPSSGAWHWRFFLLWLLIACAALTKGPAALLVPIFVTLQAALFPEGRKHWAFRSMPAGILLAVVLVAFWAVPAWQAYPSQARDQVLAGEGRRIGGNWLREVITGAWKMPFYFVTRFLPWSLVVLLIVSRWRKWSPPEVIRSAVLWITLVIVFFSLSAMKRIDYLLPAYPFAAFIVAWFAGAITQRYPRAPSLAIAIGAGCLMVSGVHRLCLRRQPEDRLGDAVVKFARGILRETKGEKIAFIRCGYHPLQALLRHNQAGTVPTQEQWGLASWVVMPISENAGASGIVLKSEVIPQVIERRWPAKLGLWRKSDLKIIIADRL